MAFAKKTWKDRIAEFPTRRRLTKEDNTSELVTVAREEGTLSQEGDAFSAENMNDLENRIDAEFTEVNGNLTIKKHQIVNDELWVEYNKYFATIVFNGCTCNDFTNASIPSDIMPYRINGLCTLWNGNTRHTAEVVIRSNATPNNVVNYFIPGSGTGSDMAGRDDYIMFGSITWAI